MKTLALFALAAFNLLNANMAETMTGDVFWSIAAAVAASAAIVRLIDVNLSHTA